MKKSSSIMLLKFISLVVVLILGESMFLSAYAQSGKGTIAGKVTDEKKESLPSVNVTVKGTYYGAATNFDGEFVISGMSPGSYVVEVSLLGYKAVQFSSVK
ncbi:MAG: carboxypeptidase regulatory-like domain-containing protein, partial [Bacteroidetes bacterium]